MVDCTSRGAGTPSRDTQQVPSLGNNPAGSSFLRGPAPIDLIMLERLKLGKPEL